MSLKIFSNKNHRLLHRFLFPTSIRSLTTLMNNSDDLPAVTSLISPNSSDACPVITPLSIACPEITPITLLSNTRSEIMPITSLSNTRSEITPITSLSNTRSEITPIISLYDTRPESTYNSGPPSNSPRIISGSTRSRLIPTSVFTPYSPTISNRTAYSDFLISRHCDLWRRFYFRHPKMLTIPRRPADAMNHNKLKFHIDPKQFIDADVTPAGAVTEMKFAACHNPDPNSKAPHFRVHNLRAGFDDSKGNIIHLIPSPLTSDAELDEILLKMAKELIKLDLDTCGIDQHDLEELWWDDGHNTEDMWGEKMLKHHRFSVFDLIPDYASTTYNLAKPVLKGSNGVPGLGEFLLKEGFVVGEYHDVQKLLVSLKKFFGVDACPTFIGHGGYHPSLFEVGVLSTKNCARRIDHPMVKIVPRGKFLMRHL